MRTLSIVILLVAASMGGCRRQAVVSSPSVQPDAAAGTGGATAREATEKFMSAVKEGDLDAMSRVWGTVAGPVRSSMSRQEWEMREVVFMRCLRNDSWRLLRETSAIGGERLLVVEVKFRDLTRSTNFLAVQGPGQRWYIRQFDVTTVEAICQRPL